MQSNVTNSKEKVHAHLSSRLDKKVRGIMNDIDKENCCRSLVPTPDGEGGIAH